VRTSRRFHWLTYFLLGALPLSAVYRGRSQGPASSGAENGAVVVEVVVESLN